MKMKRWLMGARVPLAMLMVQLISTGLQLLSRVILSEGTFIFALMAYRHIVAAICITPFALYWERGVLKKLSFVAFLWLFMVALTGIIMAMGLFYYGLKDTSATYATNMLNLIPVVTFLFSTILRIEELGLHTTAGKLKAIGAILCLGGALTSSLYMGESFRLGHYVKHGKKIIGEMKQNKTRGTLFLIASCLSYGMWFVLQVKSFKVFPYKYSGTMLTCIIAASQAALVGLCIDRKPAAWRLGWDLQLITIFYSGILATAAMLSLISWTIAQKGPTYPSMFNPLCLILVAITEALFLGEAISAGSLIGMSLVIVGLYSFLWGKNKDVSKPSTGRLPVKLETEGGSGRVVDRATVGSVGLQSASVAPAASPNNNE